MLTKNSHMSYSDRLIIETGIENGSTKQAIATTLGKDKSTIGKEIKLHRFLAYKCNLPLECANYKRCKHERYCTLDCSDYVPFKCTRRDKSPGACNGCGNYRSCRYDKYRYSAFDAQHDYQMTLTSSRQGVNATVNDIKQLGELLLPLLKKGQSIYSILQSHREIKLSEKTIYNYIENGVFQDVGVSISAIDLKRVVRRKMSKQKRNTYKPRKDNRYLTGRKYSDFLIYMEKNPNAKVVEMDTVYNDVSNGPFLQTFKFREYDLLICIYQTVKDSLYMLDGILLLEKILGKEMFEKEVEVILTDRGSEFVLAEEAEIREDGTRRTRMFYCDSISCGTGGFVGDNIIDYVSLPAEMFSSKKEYFAQYAHGDSMINANINDGDLVIFEKTSSVTNGMIGCFCVDDNIATCKRLSMSDGQIILLPENPSYNPIIANVETFKCIGKLAFVINDRRAEEDK